jgi:Domain of unknown function (DUF4328)
VAKVGTSVEPSPRHELSRIGVCVALLLTALFTQLLREWIGMEGVAVRESLLRNPRLDGNVQQTHRMMLGWTKVAMGMAVLTAVLWLVWQFQAHRQLRWLNPRARFGPWAAMLAWAIPVVNLLGPFAAHEELMLRSDPEEGANGRQRRLGPAAFVLLWWLLFAATVAIVVAAFVAAPIAAGTVHDWVHRDRTLARSLWIIIGTAGVAAIMVFWIDVRLSRKQGRAESGYRQSFWVKEGTGASSDPSG